MLAFSCRSPFHHFPLQADGEPLDVRHFQGVLLLNIPSWGGGGDPWGTSDEKVGICVSRVSPQRDGHGCTSS